MFVDIALAYALIGFPRSAGRSPSTSRGRPARKRPWRGRTRTPVMLGLTASWRSPRRRCSPAPCSSRSSRRSESCGCPTSTPRLHAIAKCETVGLALAVGAFAFLSESWAQWRGSCSSCRRSSRSPAPTAAHALGRAARSAGLSRFGAAKTASRVIPPSALYRVRPAWGSCWFPAAAALLSRDRAGRGGVLRRFQFRRRNVVCGHGAPSTWLSPRACVGGALSTILLVSTAFRTSRRLE